jgi:hypothetical protein
MPAEIAYGPLLDVIKDQVQPVLKDLEVYSTDQPPANYDLEMEVEGIRKAADASRRARALRTSSERALDLQSLV